MNTALKAAVTNYKTSLVAVQGDGSSSSGTVAVRLRETTAANPIRFDATAGRLSLAQGYTLHMAEVFTMSGTRVARAQGGSSLALDGLKAGIYLVRAVTERGTFEKRIVKND